MSVDVFKYGDPIDGIVTGSIRAALEIAINVTAQAQELAPVDKGQLKGSIGYSWNKGETANPSLPKPTEDGAVYVGTAVEHGVYQEFGTRNMAAQPFLRPAIDLEARGQKASDVIKKYQLGSMKQATSRGKRNVIL